MASKINKYWKWGIAVLVIAGMALGFYIYKWEFRAPVFELYFFNLDRGRSVFIRTPHNKIILIDGGQNSQVLRELTKVMPFYRRKIDAVIVTSALPKNAGGLAEVVRRYEIGRVLEQSVMGTSTALYALEAALQEKGLKAETVEKGDSFEIDDIKFKVLFPDPLFKYNKTSTPELVLEISYENSSALLLGDVSKTIQKSFIPEIGTVDMVEYAHSAADSRVSADLFNKINPDFIVIKKKETARATSSKTKKKFDIEAVDENKVVNIETKGITHLISDGREMKI